MQKKKGTQGIIEIENPNLVKPKSVKARDVDVSSAFPFQSSYGLLYRGWKNNAMFLWMQVGKTTELSRRERLATFSFACCLKLGRGVLKMRSYLAFEE